MNFSAAELRGPIRTHLPNPLPFGRGEGEATSRSLSALIPAVLPGAAASPSPPPREERAGERRSQ